MAKAKKGGLGKGLDALFMDNNTGDGGTINIRIAEIEPNRDQPRRHFDEAALAELADSIQQHGILQPLVVRPLPGGGYQIIAGERRWRASRMAGLSEIPAIVRDLTDVEVMEIALIENLQREDLNVMEEAAGYQVLMEQHGMTQDQVAARVGKSRPSVANALRLLNLPKEVADMVREGRLSAGHARALLSIADLELQKQTALRAVEGLVTVREIERIGKASKEREKDIEVAASETAALEEVRSRDSYYKEVELALSQELGRRAMIHLSKGKGLLQLEFYSKEDLANLVRLLQDRGEV